MPDHVNARASTSSTAAHTRLATLCILACAQTHVIVSVCLYVSRGELAQLLPLFLLFPQPHARQVIDRNSKATHCQGSASSVPG